MMPGLSGAWWNLVGLSGTWWDLAGLGSTLERPRPIFGLISVLPGPNFGSRSRCLMSTITKGTIYFQVCQLSFGKG